MPPAGFESTILASKRPRPHALDRAATGTALDRAATGTGNKQHIQENVYRAWHFRRFWIAFIRRCQIMEYNPEIHSSVVITEVS